MGIVLFAVCGVVKRAGNSMWFLRLRLTDICQLENCVVLHVIYCEFRWGPAAAVAPAVGMLPALFLLVHAVLTFPAGCW